MAGWGAAIGGICAVLVLLLREWAARKPQREVQHRERDEQQGRQDIVDGDVDAVAVRLDRVLRAEDRRAAGGPNGPAGGR